MDNCKFRCYYFNFRMYDFEINIKKLVENVLLIVWYCGWLEFEI